MLLADEPLSQANFFLFFFPYYILLCLTFPQVLTNHPIPATKTPPPTYFTLGMVKKLLGPIRPDNLVVPTGACYVSFTEERVPIVEDFNHNVILLPWYEMSVLIQSHL